jgi:hypothetical protein
MDKSKDSLIRGEVALVFHGIVTNPLTLDCRLVRPARCYLHADGTPVTPFNAPMRNKTRN